MEEVTYFFSYARRDTEFVLKLAKELRAVGVNLWLDQLDIIGGQRWDRAIGEALRTCQGMIAVLSPASLASDNMMDEVSYALEEGKLIVPVLLHPCEIPFRLRRVQYVDFTMMYDAGFAQLLRALRIEQPRVRTEPPTQLPLAAKPRTTSPYTMLTGAFIGAIVGTVWGALVILCVPRRYGGYGDIAMSSMSHGSVLDILFCVGITGTAGTITGALSGRYRRALVAAIIGIFVGFGLWLLLDESRSRFVVAAIAGISIGATVGAIIGAILEKRS